MDLNEYQQQAARTAQGLVPGAATLVNWTLGLAGETGEVVELVKHLVFHAQPIRYVYPKLVEELGDVLWYVAALATALKVPLSEMAESNLQKLQERYPNGFTLG